MWWIVWTYLVSVVGMDTISDESIRICVGGIFDLWVILFGGGTVVFWFCVVIGNF